MGVRHRQRCRTHALVELSRMTGYRLRADLSYCLIGARAIFLDLAASLSNGVQKGPPIGVEEGPPFRII
ncbi:hypothetical protein AN936_18500 [Sphingopyxis macrogoltabida]|uniref:Uncharacterized protein n=1 Tax=Sphingopyxis macrogoltabida TaxID=33050 RepID=A0A0N9UA68_SPHMC|nr:hypothetical protein AN936_18500 [Sphingopyxis macrogoltabida]